MPNAELSAVPEADDDLVLTGLSGRLPESDSIEEFAQQLFAGVDLVTADDRRWTPGLHGLPVRSGKLKNLADFDATFFGVNPKQAHLLDPQLRMLLELTHEVLVDAGYNPAELRGSRTGVYVGVSYSETLEKWNEDPDKIIGYGHIGCCRAMFANRVSYTFDLKGPSLAVNTACSSSMVALVQAATAIRVGHCDAAVVAGTNLCLNPATALGFHRFGMLSADGRCASFDASGNGYVRSEAAVAVLLQKRSAARRLYATLRGARVNVDGYKDQGITYPSSEMQRRLAEETFSEARLHPNDVAYVEAHGTGTKAGDLQEVTAIADFFCSGRHSPLLLGSVKSNMGHSEAASGLCAIAKVLVAMERGVIPQNLHYKSPKPDIPALSDGRIKVVDSNMNWEGGLASINCFGYGGANAHVILESQPAPLARAAPARTAPRLVLASGRTELAVREMLALATQHRHNPDLHALLDSVHRQNIVGHPHRGFTVLTDPPVEECTELDSGVPRPIWFVFSGMGSQWPGMARALMRLPVFADSINNSADTLRPHNIDLLHIVTEAQSAAFDDVINSLVSITAMQVALVDVLRTLEIYPDGLVGHSVGELGCAYADGSLSAEQAVLAAYWRGRSIVDSALKPGAMAAVGLSWEQCEARCPPELVPACHNALNNVTVSGPVASVERFVTELAAEGVFARRVNSSGVAFHSKYLAAAAPLLRANLMRLIPEPRLRSARWISTSLPRDKWNSDIARLSDANYHVNNLLSPVYFAEALSSVPKDAVLVEVAPHALLQAILKRALPVPDAAQVALVRRDAPDALVHLLSAVGRMYAAGAQPTVSRIYPPVPFPVTRGTPGLASHVVWDHSQKWNVARFGETHSGENVIEFDLSRADDAFIAGHNIDGRVLFPAAGYLVLVWRTIAKLNNRIPEETPVVLENVHIRRATFVSRDVPVRFLINVLNGTGEFDVSEGGSVVATGLIRLANDSRTERLCHLADAPPAAEPDLLPLNTDDIYKELRLRGYNYDGIFRGIRSSDARGTRGELAWDGNWISFIDTMVQFSRFSTDIRELYVPTRLQRVLIDPHEQWAAVAALDKGRHVKLRFYHDLDVYCAGGVELRGVKYSLAPRHTNKQATPTLQRYTFTPYNNTSMATEDTLHSERDALTVCLQLVLENASVLKLKTAEVALDRSPEALLTPIVAQILDSEPVVCLDATLVAEFTPVSYDAFVKDIGAKLIAKDKWAAAVDKDYHLVIATNILANRDMIMLRKLADSLSTGGMLLLKEPKNVLHELPTREALTRAGLVLVSLQTAASSEFVLLRHRPQVPEHHVVVDVADDNAYRWVDELREAMIRAESADMRLYVVAHSEDSGVLGLATCLRAEAGGRALRVYYLPNAKEPFIPSAATYAVQVGQDLAVNVLRDGVWGSYRHVALGDACVAQRQVEHAYVNMQTRGDLTSLRWVESPLRYVREHTVPYGVKLCSVYCASLNFRDIMLATGKLPPDALPGSLAGQECILGMEFSGRSRDGRRVMGMVAARGLATTVLADKGFLWEVPAAWTLEEAATVPVAYATAYYALQVRGRMRRSEAVLVHAGSGGVGQAAISIALAAGCTVFATVGTPDKRAFLRERFPALAPEHIGNSRDCSFEQLVKRRTGGRGVDLVLNSLAGDQLHASVRCLAEGGRFLEIGKLDLSNDTALGMSIFLKNTTFHGILLDALFEAGNNCNEKAEVVRCVTEGIASGVVEPLPATIFSDHQLEQAFRYMATGRHVGKVVLRVREEEAGGARPGAKLVSAAPRTYMHPARSYVLVGGLGGFGLELAQWMMKRGASKLVLNSRSGVRSGYQASCIRRWRAAGVQVRVSTADCCSAGGARALLREAAALGPVGGVFNLAAVLRDAFLDEQSAADFQAVARPKIDATKALDAAARELAPELEHFVVFSSVACGRGNPGQSNYGLANSAMERLCERRQADGLPGLAVQWGAIGDVGMIMNMGGNEAEINGTAPQRIASCLAVLDTLLSQPHAVVASMVLPDKRRTVGAATSDVVRAVANVLGIADPNKVSDSVSLAELGMDSLMGAEIKQTLERGYDVVFGMAEIRAMTFAKLRAMASGEGHAEDSKPPADLTQPANLEEPTEELKQVWM